jgi:hypothetical protein
VSCVSESRKIEGKPLSLPLSPSLDRIDDNAIDGCGQERRAGAAMSTRAALTKTPTLWMMVAAERTPNGCSAICSKR